MQAPLHRALAVVAPNQAFRLVQVGALMDVEIVVSIGSYSLDVNLENTDALSVPDTLHHLAEHLKAMQALPAVKKAMSTPLPISDVDD